jgi:hypothetical protein
VTRVECPHGVITTEEVVVDLQKGYARFRATVEDGEGGKATGFGTETAAGFADYVERAETRALGRALAALGIGTQFVGQDLTEGDHVADAPVVQPNGHSGDTLGQAVDPELDGNGQVPPEARITLDQARTLKVLAQTAFGYTEGERRLRHDLGFEVEERLTLRHLGAHVSVEQYQALMDEYTAHLQGEGDVP